MNNVLVDITRLYDGNAAVTVKCETVRIEDGRITLTFENRYDSPWLVWSCVEQNDSDSHDRSFIFSGDLESEIDFYESAFTDEDGRFTYSFPKDCYLVTRVTSAV